jgi:hypothetical protein
MNGVETNVHFGLLAHHTGLIDEDQLLAACRAWINAKRTVRSTTSCCHGVT